MEQPLKKKRGRPKKTGNQMIEQNSTTPVPDPTILTTQNLQREIASAREMVTLQINGIQHVFESRLDGMDKAVKLLQITNDKIPTEIIAAIKRLQELHEEKFKSIATQFLERDQRTEQTSRDSKVAVDAALQAAKEAVGEQNKSNATAIAKSEASFTKQIDQIGILIGTLQKGLDDKIEDIKGRLNMIEGNKKGASEVWGYVIAIFGLVVAAVAIFVRGSIR